VRRAQRPVERRSVTPSSSSSFWYCFTKAFLGSGQDLVEPLFDSSSSVATTGRRPDELGIIPELRRSFGLDVAEQLADLALRFFSSRRSETLHADAPLDHVLDAVEGAARR